MSDRTALSYRECGSTELRRVTTVVGSGTASDSFGVSRAQLAPNAEKPYYDKPSGAGSFALLVPWNARHCLRRQGRPWRSSRHHRIYRIYLHNTSTVISFKILSDADSLVLLLGRSRVRHLCGREATPVHSSTAHVQGVP